jgi:Tfp pilus assembly protein PilN
MAKFDVQRQHMLPPDQSQIENQQVTDNLLTRAQTLIDEEQDDVKKMNQMVLYSKVVTIRDKQLIESKKLEEEWVRE